MTTLDTAVAPRTEPSEAQRKPQKTRQKSVLLPLVGRRLLVMIPTLFGIVTLTFILTHALGGNPAAQIAGQAQDPEVIAAIEAEYGFDKPLIVQYWNYMTGLLQGDMGVSTVTNQPVLTDLLIRFPATLEMVFGAIAFAWLIGVPLGALAARTRRKALAGTINGVTFFTLAVPDFWLALVAIYVLFFQLGWLPSPTGQVSLGAAGPENVTGAALLDSVLTGDVVAFQDSFMHAILPIGVLGLLLSAPIARLMRGSMLTVMESDFVRFGRSVGLDSFTMWRYQTRAALPSVITFTGTLFALLCGGAVLMETVFSWGGVGQYAQQAIARNDFNATQGFVLVTGVMAMLAFLVVDIVLFKLDPRIRAHGGTGFLRSVLTWRTWPMVRRLRSVSVADAPGSPEPAAVAVVAPPRQRAGVLSGLKEAVDVVVEVAREIRPHRWPAAVWATVRSGNAALLAGGGIIVVMLVAAFVVPPLWPYGVLEPDVLNPLAEPSLAHPFGTDVSGFDIFVRVVYAARTDLWIAAAGVGISVILGVVAGLMVGFSRKRWVDEVAMRVVDMLQAFPVLIVAVAMVSFAGNNLSNVIWALVFINAPIFLRLVRSEVLAVREHRYIEAAGALGNSRARILARHVFPNVTGQVIVQAGVQLGYAILTVAGLAFLGVGVQAPTAEWGSMILTGKDNIVTGQWWAVTFPGLAVLLAVAAFNLLADGVSRARDIYR
ncbi:ABC transporter permease subunit [Nocardioides bruguierae]|uniref:ABC transporter permease subunit n=1 Tax=Nocardioides bruguierae TaxID=2945102 RepID=UPI0020219371|nr:ABC transporter permease subunit [Nocardioides bruguierae]MCL8025747.1 ABC transporter permease subunit [Nocardioides bruguierae]